MKQATETEKLLEKVDRVHDMVEGQVYGGGGTQLSRVDTCSICGITRKWYTDPQNGVEDRYTFATLTGSPISLRDAVDAGCIEAETQK